MEEDDVREMVLEWLERRYPPPKVVGETLRGVEAPDLRVKTPEELEGKTVDHFNLQVECKGTKGSIDDGIGKCLRYYTMWDGLLTYLAVPEDHPELSKIEAILRILKLPIGLYVVHGEGEVEERKVAQGKSIVSEPLW